MPPCVCMEDIDDQIIKSVSMRGRGAIVFPVNFLSLGEGHKCLESLAAFAHQGTLIRLARGPHSYSREDKLLGLGGSQEKSYRSMIKFSQKTDIISGFPSTRS